MAMPTPSVAALPAPTVSVDAASTRNPSAEPPVKMPEVAAPDAGMSSALNALANQLATDKTATTGAPLGMVAGGAGAGLLSLAIVGALVYLWRRNRKARKRPADAPASQRAPVVSPQTSGDTTATQPSETE
jgi:hypothetical protein